MEEYMKKWLPHLNWDSYTLVGVLEWPNLGRYWNIYDDRMTIIIEEHTELPEWEVNKSLWYSHWYVETSHEDRPLRTNAVTVIERRKRWKHKESGKVYTSKIIGYKESVGTERAEDQLSFLSFYGFL